MALVGTHVVQNLVQFGPKDQEEWKDEEEEPEGKKLAQMFFGQNNFILKVPQPLHNAVNAIVKNIYILKIAFL